MSDIVTRLRELVRTQAYRPFDEIVEAIITEAIAEIEQLQARVEELESYRRSPNEMRAAITRAEESEIRSLQKLDAAEKKLEAVAKMILDSDGYSFEEFNAVPFMDATDYVRCECGGSGKLKFTNVENADDEYYEPCPCVANGTTGWREAKR